MPGAGRREGALEARDTTDTAGQGRFVLRGRRVVLPEGVREAAVVVVDGLVAEVVAGGAGPEGWPVVDAGDGWVLPGLVDCHVHVNEPGRAEWEGFASATRAAAAGGITTLVDMPLNSDPVTTSVPALAAKREAARGRLHVDCGFHGGVVPGNAAELAALAAEGVAACKAFLVHSGIDDFPAVTRADLSRAMPVLAEAGLPLLAHAELDCGGAAVGGDPRRYQTWLRSRPGEWEDAAIALLVDLCRETRCPVHVVHLSHAGSLPRVRAARDEGLPFTAETCPHYLCLAAEDVPDGATEWKCAPPIRERDNARGLWEGLGDGTLDLVVSDHSPCLPALKRREEGDFLAAWGGIASLQLGLPSVWAEAARRGFGVPDLARWMAEAPARLAGLSTAKGRIARGCDADLLVFDPEPEWTVTADQLLFRHKVSPWIGRTVRGEVRAAWLRGRRVASDGRPEGEPGGRTVVRGASGSGGA